MGRRRILQTALQTAFPIAILAAIGWAGAACGRDEPAAAPSAPAAAPAAAAPPALSAAPPALERAAADAGFGVTELVFCEDVTLRRCEGEGWDFPAGTRRVWAYLTLFSHDAARGVTVRWLHGGVERRAVRLHVGQNPRWRTWSFMDVAAADHGWWTVEVLHPDGNTVMARRRFRIGGDGPERPADGTGHEERP